jgi:arabinan endo-1,5-alpha-L-arabinosidase
MKKNQFLLCAIVALFIFQSCKKDNYVVNTTDTVAVIPVVPSANFDINSILDNYGSLAAFSNYSKWGSYNVHDPSIIKDGEWYYCYTTDVSFGNTSTRWGMQVRKSKDLVQWLFVGWVLNNDVPASVKAYYAGNNNAAYYKSIWAPEIVKTGNEYRLYYSVSSDTARLSVIGLLTSTSPVGPWADKGLVVTSPKSGTSIQTNAIDPTVVTTPTGDQWFYYGSAWDGIYALQLDPATGLAKVSGNKGVRLASRGSTGGKINGNIEGAEVIYNPANSMYYMFISYDWIDTKYNTRVCRSTSPQGPFLDFNNVNENTNVDHDPMIIHPYKFDNHSGWQGVSHPTVFSDGNGQWFIANQGRPGENKFYMDMHVRKLFWTTEGWPVASPERYANVPQNTLTRDSLIGNWEQIILGYSVVPGFSAEQTDAQMRTSGTITLDADGKIGGAAGNTWTYNAPVLSLSYAGGLFIDKVIVSNERDWENKKGTTIVYTGMNQFGTAIWGKKK